MDWGSFFAEYGVALFWLIIAIAAAVVESQTCDLVALWFVPGALTAMVVSLFVDWVWLQIAIFLVLSASTLILAKTVLKKHLPQNKAEKLNADSYVGEHGVVTEEIDNILETGSVKLRGLVWTARSSDDAVRIPVGSVITVCEIAGVKLICEPFQAENAEKK
ncbi:MAG: NfeD family protein [Clostridia bacterium]|nr:NfeD family protein [Clostridia bacterium]